MACGQEVVIVADYSKFGRLALAKLCGLNEAHRLVTDSALPEPYREILESAGVSIHLAPLDEPSNSNGTVTSETLHTTSARTEA
jgi:hypothetical protein